MRPPPGYDWETKGGSKDQDDVEVLDEEQPQPQTLSQAIKLELFTDETTPQTPR